MSTKSSWLVAASLGACIAAWSVPAEAQMVQIEGSITDMQGQPVAGAEITASSSTERRATRTIKSKENGRYKLPYVEYGNYRITVAKQGYVMYSLSIVSRSRNGQIDLEKKGEIGPKQELPEFPLQPGHLVTCDFVLAPDGHYKETLTSEQAGTLNEAIRRADGLTAAGKFAESDAALEPILAQSEKLVAVWYLKGVNAASLGRNDDAEKFLMKARELDPKLAGVAFWIGRVAYTKGDKARSIEWMDKELEITPGSREALLNSAIAQGELGPREAAIAAWERLIAVLPTETGAYMELVGLYTDAGQDDKAAETLQKLETVAKPDARAWFNVGANYANRQVFDKAQAAFEKAQALDPNLAVAARELGYILLRKGETEAAIAQLTKYTTLAPDAADVAEITALLKQLQAPKKR